MWVATLFCFSQSYDMSVSEEGEEERALAG